MTSATGRRGMTLVELCLAGSIIGLIASQCWPSIRAFTQSIVARSRANQLIQKLYTAREGAILSGEAKTVVVSETDPSLAGSVSFEADGSSEFTHLTLAAGSGPGIGILVEESGQITIQEN